MPSACFSDLSLNLSEAPYGKRTVSDKMVVEKIVCYSQFPRGVGEAHRTEPSREASGSVQRLKE